MPREEREFWNPGAIFLLKVRQRLGKCMNWCLWDLQSSIRDFRVIKKTIKDIFQSLEWSVSITVWQSKIIDVAVLHSNYVLNYIHKDILTEMHTISYSLKAWKDLKVDTEDCGDVGGVGGDCEKNNNSKIVRKYTNFTRFFSKTSSKIWPGWLFKSDRPYRGSVSQ